MLDILLLQSTTAVAAQAAGNDFAEHDPTGLGMTLVAMAVVLSALLLIFLVFKYIGKGVDRYLSKGSSTTKTHGQTSAWDEKVVDQAGVIAAISLALHESNNMRHDEEIVQLTIQEFSRRYSPWNSKSYAVLHNRFRR